MKRHAIFYLTTVVIALLFSTIITSCNKEKTTDITSPVYKLTASEKLVLPDEVQLPPTLPAGNTRIATYYARGVQKYKSQAKAGSFPVVYEWIFVAPDAELWDAANNKAGSHGAGPYWTLSSADSIFAQQFTPVRSATPDLNSISWLLLMPKTGKTPTGIFASVDYIQRIATTGGKAPVAAPQSATDTADVLYTAVYRFTKKN